MKKLALLVTLFFGQLVFSQMATTDVGATSQLVQQVSTSMKSLAQLQKTYKMMEDASKQIQNVNGYVQQAGHLKNIINTQKNAIKNANDILKISKTKKINLSGVTTNLQMISGSIKTVQALLQNGIFNMNDGERLSKLDAEYQKAKQADGKIKSALIRARFR